MEKERKTVLTKKTQQPLHSRRLLSIGIGLRAPLDQNKRIREFNYLVLPFSTKRQLWFIYPGSSSEAVKEFPRGISSEAATPAAATAEASHAIGVQGLWRLEKRPDAGIRTKGSSAFLDTLLKWGEWGPFKVDILISWITYGRERLKQLRASINLLKIQRGCKYKYFSRIVNLMFTSVVNFSPSVLVFTYK